ncbi:von Willebrand factor A domain-containing protein 5A-like isoform X2 [Scylla paramamosain]|uniref:von Willebrand factor A domain-containing protein 5A-like isoform X2 n=1 Tax=Scylla paramamosain TaxID=85552 RepID=UPI003082E39A
MSSTMASVCYLPPHLSHFGLLGMSEAQAGRWCVVSLESVSAEVSIRGFVAQVTANMVYCNTAKHPLQVRAVLPVEEGAAVYHCEARLDGRTIVTHCMEKNKAKKIYEEAVSAGKTAIMTQEHPDSSDILTLNLGNFPAGTRAEVTLRLVMELRVQTDGGISFVLPTVLNPRYTPPDHPRIQEELLSRGLFGKVWDQEKHEVHVSQPYSIKVKAQVCGSHQIARVVSHTDPLSVTLADDAMSAQVSQDGGFDCNHDWSMLVYYKNAYQPHLLRETGDRSATGIMKDDLLMLSLFPELPTNTYSSRNEIVFVIDRSGSMGGEKMQSARATLLLFLKSLPPGCLFNIVSFGSSFSALFPEGSHIYSEKTLNEACQLQANMYADMGGTEILAPLKSIYAKPPTPGYSRQILLITDGEVSNVDQVTQLVGRHAHETRLFSVGIGHGASTALVRGVARAGRGRSEMVVQQGLLQQKVMGLVSSMVQENVQDFTIACEMEPVCRVTLVPKVPPVIFGGQHLILYARVPFSTQVKKITVRGQLGTNPVLNTMEGEHFTVVHDEAKSLHRLAARSQILQWQLDEEEGIGEDMVALSVASGVVCRHTALVGVDQESGKPVPEFPKSTVRQLSRCFAPVACTFGSSPAPASAASGTRFCFKQSAFRGKQQAPQPGSLFRATTPSFFLCDSASPQQLDSSFGATQQAPQIRPHSGTMTPSSFLCSSASPPQPNSSFGAAPETRLHFGAMTPSSFTFGNALLQSKVTPSSYKFGSATPVTDSDFCSMPCYNFGIDNWMQKADATHQPPSQPSMGLMEVVSLQQFDGSWKLIDAAHLTGMLLDALSAVNPTKSEAAWATALVLALLKKKFGEQKEEWELLATKGRTFLAGCGEQPEELLAKACLMLNSQ